MTAALGIAKSVTEQRLIAATENPSAAETAADMIFPWPRYYSSRPLRDQTGSDPPPADTCVRPCTRETAGPATSASPDSSDAYASHRPSGDRAGVVFVNGVVSSGFSVPSAMVIAPRWTCCRWIRLTTSVEPSGVTPPM